MITSQESPADDFDRKLSDLEKRRDYQLDAHAYWVRNFYTSLSIGNGAGFVLAVGAIKEGAAGISRAALVLPAMKFFFWGLVASAALPPIMRWLTMGWSNYYEAQRLEMLGRGDESNKSSKQLQFPITIHYYAHVTAICFAALFFINGLAAAYGAVLGVKLERPPTAVEVTRSLGIPNIVSQAVLFQPYWSATDPRRPSEHHFAPPPLREPSLTMPSGAGEGSPPGESRNVGGKQ